MNKSEYERFKAEHNKRIMFYKNNYDRLKAEYLSYYSYNTRATSRRSVVLGFAMSAVLIAILALSAFGGLHKSRKYGIYAVIFPILTVASIAATVYEKVKWDATVKPIAARSTVSYKCTITNCGLYIVHDKHFSSTILLFKFVYSKDGEQITDMCKVEIRGFFNRDLVRSSITLYETQSGEKIVSVTPPGRFGEPGKIEYRVL